MEKNTKSKSSETSIEKSRRILVIFTAAFLASVLIVGIIFGAISISRKNNSVMSYKGIYLKDGVANYLSATYKYDFMSTLTRNGIECFDAPEFWQSEAENGKTWADVLKENTLSYLKSIVIGSYLFDRNTRLNSDDKAVIEKAVAEVLDYRANGSIDKFNEMGAAMGFAFRDFEKAAQLMYKAAMAETVIFGYDGASLKSGNFSEECDSYFESAYSHVKLLIIRTDGELITDPETGKEVVSEYDEATRDKVKADIEYIRDLINNHNNDIEADQMSESAFDMYIEKYKTGTLNDTEGYYFSSDSSYSLEFAEDAPEIVRLALSTEIGCYAECELDIGVCFIYRYALEDGAYARIGLSHFFEDFYEKASSYVYTESVNAYFAEVSLSKRYDEGKVVGTPYNHELSVKFG
jgi:hypothetical protein